MISAGNPFNPVNQEFHSDIKSLEIKSPYIKHPDIRSPGINSFEIKSPGTEDGIRTFDSLQSKNFDILRQIGTAQRTLSSLVKPPADFRTKIEDGVELSAPELTIHEFAVPDSPELKNRRKLSIKNSLNQLKSDMEMTSKQNHKRNSNVNHEVIHTELDELALKKIVSDKQEAVFHAKEALKSDIGSRSNQLHCFLAKLESKTNTRITEFKKWSADHCLGRHYTNTLKT